ncbi:hypothetical protein XOC_0667 [Xanthomonas oryzae pv. oryzicola BLS256]|uniref:Uncharacterized protein n=1 Tax=Xanthomonas oryzae pv. oryzicola (strain BLS256) TaxID=383407 RepID=G7TBJ5_XANOB|nr:hypothetical protein XOC_0667 [Xanthomonas oryzae pv. oryzicola BLS256]QEO99273.1 hypothetical protein XOCgx_4286 [Xanthomonas oryzae pv. oryzicola]
MLVQAGALLLTRAHGWRESRTSNSQPLQHSRCYTATMRAFLPGKE